MDRAPRVSRALWLTAVKRHVGSRHTLTPGVLSRTQIDAQKTPNSGVDQGGGVSPAQTTGVGSLRTSAT